MLKQLNRFLYGVISEQSDGDDDAKKKVESFTTNEFFFKFIQGFAEECGVLATKQRENTFLVYGKLKDIKTFFSKFKVDSTFMENPAEFKIYSPMFTYGDEKHFLKLDEDYPIFHGAETPTLTHEVDNITRDTVTGRWYPMFDDEISKKVKSMKPAEITKYFKSFFPKADKKFNEETEVYVEFQVNCDRRANQVWDEMSEYAKEPDEMNELHNADPEDFDYTQLVVKKQDSEADMKPVMKDVREYSKLKSK